MDRRALVIGNKDYRFIESLNNPINDAKMISEILTLKGFAVTYFENLEFECFLKEVNLFSNLIEESKSLVLFYYAGHSIQLMDSNYLLPVDITKDLSNHKNIEHSAVYLGDITNALNKSKADKVVILDACRNHDFTQEIIASNDIFNKGLCEIESSHGMAIIYSTQPGNTAGDGTLSSKNGCFTQEFAKNIALYGLTLSQVIINTRETVLEKTNYKQIPWSSNSISNDLSLDHVGFPGELFAEVLLPSNGIDTISCSDSNVFLSTQKKQLFMFRNISNVTSVVNKYEDTNRYVGAYPHILQLTLENDDYVNESLFLDDDIMLAVSENGYVYLYEVQRMLSGKSDIDYASGYSKTDYNPLVLFEKSVDNPLYCINHTNDYVFVSGSSGILFRLNISDLKNTSQINSFDEFNISNYHITSIASNSKSGAICVSDEQCVYFLNKNVSVIKKVHIRSSNILYSESLGFVIASNDYKLYFFSDVGNEVTGSKLLEFKQHPLRDIFKDDLYITSLDVWNDRYLVIGTSKPSILMYDTSLDSTVNEKFLDIHMTSPFYSSVYDLCIYQNKYLFSRSKLNYFGIWELGEI
ncbi:MAG: caspase family protein [Pseudomonas sp.]|nr:caspase family protein [Pseudomonas sp.]